MRKRMLVFGVVCFLVLSACVMRDVVKERTSYPVIIIGSGPAGLTAGVYTARAGVDTLIMQGNKLGGALADSPAVENWIGYTLISGYDLMEKMIDHAKHTGCTFAPHVVERVDFSQKPYKIFTNAGKTYEAGSVIIATGVARKQLNCPGEQEYWTKGVSVCATCDAPFYRGKKVIVVGGGNSALVEAHHLARFASEVVMVHRSAALRSVDAIKERVQKDPKIKILYNTQVKEIVGDDQGVTGVVIESKGKREQIKADGVFVAIGFEPKTELFKGHIELDDAGYPKVYESTRTSKPGVFICGDIANSGKRGKYRQAIVAAGQGCMAALDCIDYLDSIHLDTELSR